MLDSQFRASRLLPVPVADVWWLGGEVEQIGLFLTLPMTPGACNMEEFVCIKTLASIRCIITNHSHGYPLDGCQNAFPRYVNNNARRLCYRARRNILHVVRVFRLMNMARLRWTKNIIHPLNRLYLPSGCLGTKFLSFLTLGDVLFSYLFFKWKRGIFLRIIGKRDYHIASLYLPCF